MTIRMLKAWNGNPEQAIVSLSASEETRLVGIGLASFDLDGAADGESLVKGKSNPVTGGIEISLPTGKALDVSALLTIFGDDEMIIGTFANRPAATAVSIGKEFMATDVGRARWVSDGTQWIALTPCDAYKTAVSQSITDSAGQSTTETNLASILLPANMLQGNDGLEIDLIWSCTNSAAAKRIRTRFGGAVLSNLDLTTHLVFRQQLKLRNRGSQSAQVEQANSTTIFGPIGSVGIQTFTVDFSQAQNLTITGQFPVSGTGTNTLTLEESSVRII